jgi:PilZ domain
MARLKPQEVQLDTDGYMAMTCPFCTTKRVASAEHYCDLHVAIGVECVCGHTYDIIIDTRQYCRKNLQLPGTYTLPNSKVRHYMSVETLSFTGSCFRIGSSVSLQVGTLLGVTFQLDNDLGTEIYKKAVVRWMKNGQVGVAFCDVQTYDKELGCYLRSS